MTNSTEIGSTDTLAVDWPVWDIDADPAALARYIVPDDPAGQFVQAAGACASRMGYLVPLRFQD